jgi:hypothetical protein
MPVGAPFFGSLPTMKSPAAQGNFPLDRGARRGDDVRVIRANARFGEAVSVKLTGRRFFERARGLA